jgi:predicted deacylase
MRVIRQGTGPPVVGIVGCLHGNEAIGRHVIERISRLPLAKGTLITVVANEEAAVCNARYVDADLNRSFPGNPAGDHEQRLAARLLPQLAACDFVLDIHSTTAKTRDFAIITRKEAGRLAREVPLSTVVWMSPVFGRGGALIDHVRCGVSLEFDAHTDAATATAAVIGCLRNLGMLRGKAVRVAQEQYAVYRVMLNAEHPGPLANFEKARIGTEEFYPVLSGERAYADLRCLAARKLDGTAQ